MDLVGMQTDELAPLSLMLFKDQPQQSSSQWIGTSTTALPSYPTLLPSVFSPSTDIVPSGDSASPPASSDLLPLFQTLKGAALAILVLWTIVANSLVFLVLYKNPRLQTVPNLLVGNLAFSDLCLAIIVLPLSAIYVLAGEWLFPEMLCEIFVSADILCSTASIWNLSIVGLDRYWAITTPVAYMAKRNKRTASLMIMGVWFCSSIISLAPLLGWKQIAEHGNMVKINDTWQCTFLDLPSYTIYSTTGSFFIPTILMFFVYFKIYQAFAKHRARQIYRQKVIRKHIESTILHEISHVLPTSDEFAKDEEEDDEDEDEEEESGSSERRKSSIKNSHCSRGLAGEKISKMRNGVIVEEDEEAHHEEEKEEDEEEDEETDNYNDSRVDGDEDEEKRTHADRGGVSCLTRTTIVSAATSTTAVLVDGTVVIRKNPSGPLLSALNNHKTPTTGQQLGRCSERNVAFKHQRSSSGEEDSEMVVAKLKEDIMSRTNNNNAVTMSSPMKRGSVERECRKERVVSRPIINTAITYEKVKRHKQRKERKYRKSLQCKPRAISAAKERRGVKVLGIILGAYCCCWTPFFIMYVLAQFCSKCQLNPHIEMFITWLGRYRCPLPPLQFLMRANHNSGYSNSAMNPIIYTVFNRDYQIALKRIFTHGDKNVLAARPSVL